MLTVNMNKPLSPTKPSRIADGPDIDKFDIQRPKAPPIPPPRNWQKEQLYFAEPRAEYNQYGNFSINGAIRESHWRAMRMMQKDIAMFSLSDQLRRH
jgi:hypothetical protein